MAISTACSAESRATLPGSTVRRSALDTTCPGLSARRLSTAIGAGGSGRSSPSTTTAWPRISSRCSPAVSRVTPCSGRCLARARASAPSRERSGCRVGTPREVSGSAVTGPTQAATTGPPNAASSASSSPSALAAPSMACTAGALVKATASTEPEIVWLMRRRRGEMSRYGSQR